MVNEQKDSIIFLQNLPIHANLTNLVDLLSHQTQHRPEQIVYTYLEDGEQIEQPITHAELDRQARAIAAQLQALNAVGERVLLLYPAGLDFIAAFFGCLYAGAVAVPAFPPRLNRPSPRIQGIIADCGAAFALTTTAFAENLTRRSDHIPALAGLHWLITDQIPAGAEQRWQKPALTANSLAFLQYTSGSTSDPKGVMVTHGNLIHNMAMITHGFHLVSGDIGLFWLPSYHDMGLIGGILTPLYINGSAILMAPTAFLQKPLRWLQAISHYKATITGAPNFAYQLCLDKITPEQGAGLSLDSLKTTFCGAEPVRRQTLRAFAEKFGPQGFPENSFYPCYGMAEATLIISGNEGPAGPTTITVQRASLEQNQIVLADPADPTAQEMTACGHALLGQEIVIVNPDTHHSCPAGTVGEIWVTGRSIAQGYWGRPEQTAATFQAHTANNQQGPYLRTGDLGFFHEGQLYVTGRLKDLIIIRGRNHYPQDLELTVEQSHPSLEPGMGAAFAIDHDNQEKLVIVHEMSRSGRRSEPTEIIAAIRAAITQQHELQPHAIQLLKPMSIPKTSSGKIRRHACKQQFLDGTLATLHEWRESRGVALSPMQRPPTPTPTLPPAQNPIAQWLITRLAAQLQIEPSQIDSHQPFANYGLDSVQTVSLSGDLQTWLQRPLEPTLLWDYPTIAELAAHLSTGTGVALSAMQRPLSAMQRPSNEPIAIVGLSCRFPQANNPHEFWQLLLSGRDAISEVPADRWPIEPFYAPDPATPGKMNTRWGGFLDQVDQFDPHFFAISPREAGRMDPQQRLLLEVAWEALENAAIPPGRIANTQTGVFIGISSYDYSHLQFSQPELIDAYAGTGNAHSIAANRLSYTLDLRGPSLAIDTACSSSLVAVHQAIQSLRNGECDLALAGGVNLLLQPELTITFSQARMMAADGRCKTFDARADGYVRGEGAGVVVLKRLSAAERDGDPILALLLGSAVNQDGRSNGLTAPNGLAQQAVMRQALANANVAPAGIHYIEAHGTGTPLGDPIEIQALRAVLDESHQQPYFVGSVKTNIGHLEAAAGIAGLLKTVLALHHQTIPAHLHLQEINPYIRLDGSQLTIPTSPVAWPAGPQPRLAGVSSFGFGGTNAHLIVSDGVASGEWQGASKRGGTNSNRADNGPADGNDHGPMVEKGVARPEHLLTLSAKSQIALQQLIERYAALENDRPLADFCYTTNTGREHFPHRAAFTASTWPELQQKLAAPTPRPTPAGPPKVAFLFTGQGSQYPGMAAQLYHSQPTFRAALDQCASLLADHLDRPLLPIILGNEYGRYIADNATPLLNQTIYTQPALFSLQVALAQLWLAWGIEPAALLGHSIGEYSAAWLAGVFSLADGLKLVVARGRLMQQLTRPGAMANVFASPAQLDGVLDSGRIDLAAINGRQHLVIAGQPADIEAACQRLGQTGIESRPLTVSHAFHSHLMEPMLADFKQIASTVHYHPPRRPLLSNVTGRLHTTTPDAAYWSDHIRATVQFAGGLATLGEMGITAALEIGPQPHLIGMARRAQPGWLYLPSLRPGQGDWQIMLDSLGQLYTAGLNPNWNAVHQGHPQTRRPFLPTTPFERQRYWVEVASGEWRVARQRGKWRANQSGGVQRLPVVLPIYEANLGQGGLPAALAAVANDFWGPGDHQIVSLVGELSGRDSCQILLTPLGPNQATAQIFCPAGDNWQLQASAQLLRKWQVASGEGQVESNGFSQVESNGFSHWQVEEGPKPPTKKTTEEIVWEQVAQVLQLEPGRINPDQPLEQLGLDSLMVLELRNRLQKELGVALPVADIFQAATIRHLSQQLSQAPAPPPTISHDPADPQQPFPLAVNQEALWFLDQLSPAEIAFNVAGAVRLTGPLDIAALERAANQLVAHHPALRTTFHLQESRPVQQVQPNLGVSLERLNMAAWPQAQQLAYLRHKAYQPFDLEQGPPIRLLLADLFRPDEHLLLLSISHLVTDFWSISLLVRELSQLYQQESNGFSPSSLTRPAHTYADFVRWQAQMLNSPAGEEHRRYWLAELSGQLPTLDLPLDYVRPPAQTFAGDTITHQFSPTLTQALKGLSQQQGATLYMTLIAAFQLLLHRYTGQEDLLIGSVLSGREQAELADLVGYFINPVAIRADFGGQPSFSQLLSQVRQKVLGAMAHQDYPLPLLAKELNLNRDPARPPIFEAMFIMQKAQLLEEEGLSGFALGLGGATLKVADLTVEALAIGGLPAQLDLTLMMAETAEGLAAAFHYNTALFAPNTLRQMAIVLENLLTAIVADPNCPVGQLPLGKHPDRLDGPYSPAGTTTIGKLQTYPTVHQLFEQQVARTPAAIALQMGQKQLNYAQLNRQADDLAAVLRGLGVGAEALVGICLERSLEMVVALLAVLKAGGAYIPLDPAFPPERLELMRADAQPQLIISNKGLEPYNPAGQPSQSNHSAPATPDSLAYLIYTSGSTGQPKGVQITHHSVVNFLQSMAARPGLTAADSLLAVTTLSFDIAVLELFLPLTVGGRVIIAGRETASDGPALLKLLADSQATVMQATPATWRLLLEAGWGQQPRLSKILCGGEALPRNLADQLLSRCDELWNLYGPTETTVWSAIGQVTAGQGPVPIGQPIANTQLYLLDPAGQPLPAGPIGQLWIGGAGVARGYLNRPELTAEKFVNGRYNTGDLARYTADGQLIFLGRGDQQVKIRGYRIELGDIEAALSQHPAVSQVVVVAREERPGDKRLVAYLVTRAKPEIAYRQFLADKLPDYMIPAAFVPMAALPLTPNNKVDRKALPRPELLAETVAPYEAPQTELEKELASLLAGVLGLERVGRQDNFFDLGGNSLLATRLIFQARQQFQTPIPLRQLFADPTVAGLAKIIQASQPDHSHFPLVAAISLAELQAEAQLPADIVPAGTPHTAKPATILLTGVTGFVGAFLLSDLMAQTSATLACLVRAPDEASGRERIRRNLSRYGLWQDSFAERLVILLGDLGEAGLGLPAGQLAQLAEKIDLIYHNGAMVNFVHPYQAHKAANVQGTISLLRLACQHHPKPFHFVSTLSIFHSGQHNTGRVFQEQEDLATVGVPFGGYAQSKWVAEQLVMAAGRRGLPVAIYRPGVISGHSQRPAWNQEDMMSALVQASLAMGLLPDLEIMVDIVPVDYVSAAIVHLSSTLPDVPPTTPIFHLANPQPLPYQQLLKWLGEQGVMLRPVPFEQWRDELIHLAGQTKALPYLPLLEEITADQVFMPPFDCRNTLAGLANSSIRCHPVDSQLLQNYLEVASSQVASGK